MKKHILIINMAVALTLIICGIGVILLSHDVSSMTRRYENEITRMVRTANDLNEVSENVYHLHSMLWNLVLTDDDQEHLELEEKISTLSKATGQRIHALEEGTESEEQKEAVLKLSKAFNDFEEHIAEVFPLDKLEAGRYVGNNIAVYVNKIGDALDTLNDDVKEKYDVTLDRYEVDISRGRIYRNTGLTAMGVTIIIMIVVMVIGSRRIIEGQNSYEKDNENRVTSFQQNIINAMANLIESRDGETGEHVKRTCTLVYKLAKELQKQDKYKDILTDKYIDMLVKAAPLHDVGKIRVPDAVLQKPGKLTSEEFEVIKQHAADGGSIIYETMGELEEKEYLEIAHDVATYHHEKWDGRGYPTGKKGENIPLCARIMAVADVYDALVSRRCYKDPIPMGQAIEIIDSCSGTQFDPAIVKAFDSIISDYSEETD